ncbi:hypothetical protein DES43_1103 [Aquamicrobium defluvii]|nr:hypothetical protein DES43_1103 [Aquamicrobium defluvii]
MPEARNAFLESRGIRSRTALPSENPALPKLARQRAPVHAQPARGLRYVEVGFDQRLMNPLSFERLQRGATTRQRHPGIAFGLAESRLDLIGVRRLGEVVAGPSLIASTAVARLA